MSRPRGGGGVRVMPIVAMKTAEWGSVELESADPSLLTRRLREADPPGGRQFELARRAGSFAESPRRRPGALDTARCCHRVAGGGTRARVDATRRADGRFGGASLRWPRLRRLNLNAVRTTCRSSD